MANKKKVKKVNNDQIKKLDKMKVNKKKGK